MTSKPDKKIEPKHLTGDLESCRDPKRMVYIDEAARDANPRNLVADLKAGLPEGTKFVGAGAIPMTVPTNGDAGMEPRLTHVETYPGMAERWAMYYGEGGPCDLQLVGPGLGVCGASFGGRLRGTGAEDASRRSLTASMTRRIA